MVITFESLMDDTINQEGFEAFNIISFRNDHIDIEYWKAGSKYLKSFSEKINGDWIVVKDEVQ